MTCTVFGTFDSKRVPGGGSGGFCGGGGGGVGVGGGVLKRKGEGEWAGEPRPYPDKRSKKPKKYRASTKLRKDAKDPMRAEA